MSRIRVVAAGCGRMSTNFLKAALATGAVDVVGLVDPDLARAEERRAELGLPDAAIGPDLGAMLSAQRPEAVFDIVVPAVRHQVATTALRHGCHILTEKPMADTLANARNLIRVAREAGHVHAVIQNRRYHPGVRRTARFLRSGAIGDVTGVYCDFFLGPHFGGFREEMAHVLLLDMAIHTFDVGRLFAGAAPASVWCRESNPRNSWFSRDASAIAVFEMAGGVVFNYRGSWCADGLRTSWESAWRITGTRGALLWDGEDSMRAEVLRAGDGRDGLFALTDPIEVPPLDGRDRVGGHQGVIEDFIQAIRTGIQPETAGPENIKSLAMVAAAIESAEAGQTVAINEVE